VNPPCTSCGATPRSCSCASPHTAQALPDAPPPWTLARMSPRDSSPSPVAAAARDHQRHHHVPAAITVCMFRPLHLQSTRLAGSCAPASRLSALQVQAARAAVPKSSKFAWAPQGGGQSDQLPLKASQSPALGRCDTGRRSQPPGDWSSASPMVSTSSSGQSIKADGGRAVSMGLPAAPALQHLVMGPASWLRPASSPAGRNDEPSTVVLSHRLQERASRLMSRGARGDKSPPPQPEHAPSYHRRWSSAPLEWECTTPRAVHIAASMQHESVSPGPILSSCGSTSSAEQPAQAWGVASAAVLKSSVLPGQPARYSVLKGDRPQVHVSDFQLSDQQTAAQCTVARCGYKAAGSTGCRCESGTTHLSQTACCIIQ